MANYAVKKIHKNMYPAMYNFKDEADGTIDADIVFIDSVFASDSTYSAIITAVEDGHRKVIKFSSAGDNGAYSQWRHNETETSGTREFWIKYIDNGVGKISFIMVNEGMTELIDCYFSSADNRFYIKDGGGWNDYAAPADTWHRLKVTFSCATDTFSFWLNDVLLVDNQTFINGEVATSIPWGKFQFELGAGANALEAYVDAYGEGDDVNYNVGDNSYWRNYKESTDSFEEDDIGTQGTSIKWVDVADTAASVELVQEFNEHKKILRQYYSSGAGGYDNCTHSFASQAKAGWWEGWIKVSDITVEHRVCLFEDATTIIIFKIDNSKFQYYDSGGVQQDVSGAPAPVNSIWYHIYLRWYDAATDYFEIWIDNIQYESVAECRNNQTSGINKTIILAYGAAAYIYLDAPMSSLDSDVRADNRTFDYNDSYTREDITTEIINVIYSNKIYGWRMCAIFTKELFKKDLYIFQVYDINSILAFEGEIKGRYQSGVSYTYPLRDKNWDDLHNRSSNTFSSAKIHDPAVSGSMLKTIVPTVGQEDGDLILVNADTKTDTYSPISKYYPDLMALQDIADLADSCIIVEASGKVHLDDDLASGTALDVDTASDKDSMTDEPRITDILETINYFEIFGAINPDTGIRFSKVIDNSGTDKKRKWRITNNNFRTQTDLDNYAAKLEARVIPVRIFTIYVQGLGIHDMGTTLDYKFVHSPINILQANYYIIEERVDFDTSEHVIVLSEGMIEESKYSAGFEREQEYADSYAAEIYETDVNTISMRWYTSGVENAIGSKVTNNEEVRGRFYLSDSVDTSRTIKLTFVYFYHDDLTIDGELTIFYYPCDGTTAHTNIEVGLNWGVAFTNADRAIEKVYTFSTSDLVNDAVYDFYYTCKDANNIYVKLIQVEYYIKRTV